MGAADDTPRNLALGRPYTLVPAPNYGGHTSRVGTSELTDGGYAATGTLWSQPATVGWFNARPVTVTIDLGAAQVLGEVTWHTAAGSAGVTWPLGLYALGSVDGVHYAPLGDLVAPTNERAGPLSETRYADYTYSTKVPPIPVRYLRLLADSGRPFLFVDEIEARAAPGASAVPAAYPIVDTTAYFWREHRLERAATAIRRDGRLIRARLDSLAGDPKRRDADVARLARAVSEAIAADRRETPLQARLPLSPAHARAFAVLGEAEAAAGAPALQAWPANPWAPLSPLAAPAAGDPARVEIAAMRGEARSGAFNLRNATGAPIAVAFSASVTGVDAGELRLAPIDWTGTETAEWVAAKILSPSTRISIPAGLTVQVWLTWSPGASAPGRYEGSIIVKSGDQPLPAVPLILRVLPGQLPAKQGLQVSGWDYAPGAPIYGLTAANLGAAIDYLRSHAVTTPWSTRAVFGYGAMDATGRVTRQPSTEALDRWLAQWPTAAHYRVFVSVGPDIGGVGIDNPAFPRAVRAWLAFWDEALRQRGRDIRDFELLLFDEPHTAAQDSLAIAWSEAVKRSGIPVRLWVNPNWASPTNVPARLVELTDTVVINLRIAEASEGAYWTWANELVGRGKTVELYGTDGPAALMDPYAYYRLAAWRAYSVGATGVSFWSFADTGGADASSGFAARSMQFTPYFLDHDAVAGGKQMEALAEGARDFEYLRMLAAVAGSDRRTDIRRRAQSLLRESISAVLGPANTREVKWSASRDRTAADQARQRIAEFLDSVSRAGHELGK